MTDSGASSFVSRTELMDSVHPELRRGAASGQTFVFAGTIFRPVKEPRQRERERPVSYVMAIVAAIVVVLTIASAVMSTTQTYVTAPCDGATTVCR